MLWYMPHHRATTGNRAALARSVMGTLRSRAHLAIFLFTAALSVQCQTQERPPTASQPYTLSTQSNVVLVPTTVELKHGAMLYGLKASQFVVEDNDVPQKLLLDEDTDGLGLSLAVVIQCSRSAIMESAKMTGLGSMLDGIAGGAPREVAIVSYGSEPKLLEDFSPDPDAMMEALGQMQPCDTDSGAATLDAVAYATSLLESRKNHFRHAVLLISETRDHGSKAKPAEVIASLGRTNTVVESVSFSPGKTEMLNALRYGGGSGPLGLLVMAVNAVKRNAPEELARLSGGEYLNFTTQKGFDRSLQQLSNHVHNYYLLSFQPAPGASGLHDLRVKVPEYPHAQVRARENYFLGVLEHTEENAP